MEAEEEDEEDGDSVLALAPIAEVELLLEAEVGMASPFGWKPFLSAM